ncbi:MAG: lipoprotein [Pseudomonadota bacterium]|nr:lipoprotein [Pseudomonadota bacterium]
MRVSTLPIGVLVLAVLLSGCGQKGPLYREAPGVEAAVPAETAAGRQDNGDAADTSD